MYVYVCSGSEPETTHMLLQEAYKNLNIKAVEYSGTLISLKKEHVDSLFSELQRLTQDWDQGFELKVMQEIPHLSNFFH